MIRAATVRAALEALLGRAALADSAFSGHPTSP
jgi:hypothetical protein